MSEPDSLWLQKSINVPDPIPEKEGTPTTSDAPKTTPESTPALSQKEEAVMPPPSQSVEKRTPSSTGEMDLTKMVLDTSGFLRTSSVQRPSVRYQSRASVSNAAFISAQEFDNLRAQLSQTKRELLKVSDVQKDLEYARFDLVRTQEEMKMLRESNQTLKHELDDCTQRAEKEHKARLSLERRVSADGTSRTEEVEKLKQIIAELREENAKRMDVLTEQQEAEFQTRMRSMREELTAAAEEVDRLTSEVAQSQRAREATETRLSGAQAELAKSRLETADVKGKLESMSKQCQQLEQQHRQFVANEEEARAKEAAAQRALHEDRVQQLARSKDATIAELQEEMQHWKDKTRTTAEELAAARHTVSALRDDVKQLTTDRAKEVRRLLEEHRLALCEKEVQMEAAVREAKGSKTSVEEEAHSLRRQLSRVSSELSTVAGVLAQREKQLAQLEEQLTCARDRCLAAEQENAELASEAQESTDAAEHALERVGRLVQQKDELEEAFSKDLREAKARICTLEAELMQNRNELTVLRKEQMKLSSSDLSAARDLRTEVAQLAEECNALKAAAAERRRFEDAAEEYRRRYDAEKAKAAALEVELASAVNRCTAVEAKLEEQSRRAITHAVAHTPLQTLQVNHSSSASVSRVDKCGCSVSSRCSKSPSGGSVKRARTEDARVFAISGFDGNDLLLAAKQLPNVAVVECKSNVPVPSNLTHLITNGMLTVKLLTALVRGCWVLPEAYVLDSLKEQRWLSEEKYGFQHAEPPLLKKRVALTEAFTACKHYSTASVLLKEGGAIVMEDAEEADMLLCTNSEARHIEGGWNWEKLMDTIYPPELR